jgi:methionine-rich copper-binding protein CopC
MRLKSSIALSLLATLLLASPAKAHDLLIEIEPAAGAVVTESSFEAKLTFNNPLLVVAGETNAELSTKPVGSTDWVNHDLAIAGAVLTASISLSEPGQYDLRWKVVSSDGHPISGESTFTLDTVASENPEDSESPILIAPAPTAEQASGEGSLVGFYIGLAMVILGVIFAPIGLIIRRRARQS